MEEFKKEMHEAIDSLREEDNYFCVLNKNDELTYAGFGQDRDTILNLAVAINDFSAEQIGVLLYLIGAEHPLILNAVIETLNKDIKD